MFLGTSLGSGHRPGFSRVGLIDADDIDHGFAVEEGHTVVAVEIGNGVGHVRDGLDLGNGSRVGDHENIVVGQGSGEGHAIRGRPFTAIVCQLHGILGKIHYGASAIEDLKGLVV